MGEAMRLFYAGGPGDVVGTFEHWKSGRDDPHQVSMTYSGQFFTLCRELSARGEVVSACPRRATAGDGQLNVSNVPKPALRSGGIAAYLFTQVRYGMEICSRAMTFRANVAVVAEGTSFWFVFSRLARAGVRVVPALHCVLWPKLLSPGKSQRIINRLDGAFFHKHAWAVLSISKDATAQVKEITNGRHAPVTPFLPTYRSEAFEGIPAPDLHRTPFRVLFAGRIEENKGVLDLLEAASLIRQSGGPSVRFDLCGEGSALEKLREEVRRRGLSDAFVCHGYCNDQQMHRQFAAAHAVVVPTRSTFIEGFNKLVAEGVLSGRPVITSRVCPALDVVKDAVAEVEPDDAGGYAQAVVSLAEDRNRYEALRRNCGRLAPQFYDTRNSWKEGLKSIILQPMRA